MRPAPILAAVPFVAALAAPLIAQSTNYTAPGSLGSAIVDRGQALETAIEEARWQLGAVRIDPWLSLRELAWVEQRDLEGNTEGDLTATAGAGIDAYLPVGSRTTFAAQAHPEYVWWRDRTEQRRLAGRYALGVFVDANRLALELVARSSDSTTDATPELERRVENRQDRLEADVELRVFRRISVFARGSASSVEVGDEAAIPGLDALDRDETWWVGGLRFALGDDISVGAGVGESRSEFASAGPERDSRGESLYGELRWLRPKLQIAVEGFRTELRAAPGSSFEGFDGSLASGRVRWQPRERFAWSVYGLRSLGWSLETATPFYVDQRWGSAIELRPGWRTGIRLFVERGENRYAPAASGARRVDDVSSDGVGLDLELFRGVALAIDARRTKVDSPMAGFDRELAEIRAALTFGGGGGGVF